MKCLKIFKMKNKLINLILQCNSVSILTNSERLIKDRKRMISNEQLFIELCCLEESVLAKIANELNINIS